MLGGGHVGVYTVRVLKGTSGYCIYTGGNPV